MEEGKAGRAEGRDEGRSEDWKRGKRWNAAALGSLWELYRGGISIALPIRSVDLIVPLIARVLVGDQKEFSWVSRSAQPTQLFQRYRDLEIAPTEVVKVATGISFGAKGWWAGDFYQDLL